MIVLRFWMYWWRIWSGDLAAAHRIALRPADGVRSCPGKCRAGAGGMLWLPRPVAVGTAQRPSDPWGLRAAVLFECNPEHGSATSLAVQQVHRRCASG